MAYLSPGSNYRMPSLLERNVLSGVAQLYSGSSHQTFFQSPGANITHQIGTVLTASEELYHESGKNRRKNYVINLDARVLDIIPQYVGSFSRRPSPSTKYHPVSGNAYERAALKQYHTMIADKYQNIITAGLLRQDRPLTQFIEDAREVETFVKETFEKVTGKTFPDDIIIWVCTEENLMKAHVHHGGVWNPGIQGFAINKKVGARRIFVRKNNMDALMLVIGHEVGHVFTDQLPNPLDEEAKAFAFEVAWVRTIIEHNIAGLKGSFNVNFTPAANGLHNIAFAFVQKLVKKGKEALDIYWELVRRTLAVEAHAEAT